MAPVTYSIFVPALGVIKITDCSADVISMFLSNRAETSRYLVMGSDGSVANGMTWLANVEKREGVA